MRSSPHTATPAWTKERGRRNRLQITHCSGSESKMPAQGGDKDTAGTTAPKHKKASVRQASSLPEPQRPDRLVTHLGSYQLCSLDSSTALSLVPSAQTSVPSCHPQLQLPALFRAVHSTQMASQWQLPKTLLSSYSHNRAVPYQWQCPQLRLFACVQTIKQLPYHPSPKGNVSFCPCAYDWRKVFNHCVPRVLTVQS